MAKVLRKVIEVDEEFCNGCGKCVLACQKGAIAIIDGKAKLISETLPFPMAGSNKAYSYPCPFLEGSSAFSLCRLRPRSLS